MAIVTGSLKDLTGSSMNDRRGILRFVPHQAGIRSAGSPGQIVPPAAKDVVPGSDGSFSVDLATTTTFMNDMWYEIEIQWVEPGPPDAGRSGSREDFPGWQVRVPVNGGVLSDLLAFGPPDGGWGGPIANLTLVIVSLTRPSNLQIGQLWLQAEPEDHANPDNPLNTGRLYRGV